MDRGKWAKVNSKKRLVYEHMTIITVNLIQEILRDFIATVYMIFHVKLATHEITHMRTVLRNLQ